MAPRLATILVLVAALFATSVPAASATIDGSAAAVAHSAKKHKKKAKHRKKRAKKQAAAQTPAVQDDCSAADADPAADPTAAARATLCLLNIERTSRGLGRVELNSELSNAALGHAQDMVSRGYFAHDSLSGLDFVHRILNAAYVQPGLSYILGENLAWGQGSLSTPRQIMAGWMNSPGHRANILNGSFADLGVGIVIGAPVPGGMPNSTTYATEFGNR